MEENETANESDLLRQNEDSVLSEEQTQIEDKFETTDEEEDEDEDETILDHETMLDDQLMPVFDMKSYVTNPFEEITDDLDMI
jgi:hypothetical protein